VTPLAFGQQLRRQREKSHLTLRQVADQTKVSAGFFQSLESGECARWPGGIYSRGFVRAYAAAIGLDPEQVVTMFGECYPQFAPAAPPEEVTEVEEPPQTPLARLKAAIALWFGEAADTRR
jgi:cytoskeletal protein RodZ